VIGVAAATSAIVQARRALSIGPERELCRRRPFSFWLAGFGSRQHSMNRLRQALAGRRRPLQRSESAADNIAQADTCTRPLVEPMK
jgi:hypothetical protein